MMVSEDGEALGQYRADMAPETIDWESVLSECGSCQSLRSVDGLHSPTSHRSKVIQYLQSQRDLTQSEAEAVVAHAIHLSLLTTPEDGNTVYIPQNGGEE